MKTAVNVNGAPQVAWSGYGTRTRRYQVTERPYRPRLRAAFAGRTAALSGSRQSMNHTAGFYRESAALLGSTDIHLGGSFQVASSCCLQTPPRSFAGTISQYQRLLLGEGKSPATRPLQAEHTPRNNRARVRKPLCRPLVGGRVANESHSYRL